MRKVHCYERGGAGGIGRNTRPLEAEGIGHAAHQEAHAMARDGVGIGIRYALLVMSTWGLRHLRNVRADMVG